MTTETNGMTDLEVIKAIQKKLLLAMEEGNDELKKQYSDELVEARATVAKKQEMEGLRAQLENRDLMRKRAEKVVQKCKAQREAIDDLLQLRDEILPLLKEVVDKSKLLPAMERASWEQFVNAQQLAGNARTRLPQGYLPARLRASTLEVRGGTRSAVNLTQEAHFYLRNALGLLASLQRVDSPIPCREATFLEAIDEPITTDGGYDDKQSGQT